MLKRALTTVAMACALVAIHSVRPSEVLVGQAFSNQDELGGGGTCAIYCVSCGTHHLIAC